MDNPKSAASSSLPRTMKVIGSPTLDKAFTNKAYCSPKDASYFLPGPGLEEGMAYVKKQIVLTVSPHDSITDGCLGLNVVHRQIVKVAKYDDVQVARYVPEKGSELAILTLNLIFTDPGKKVETLDGEKLKPELTRQYGGQIMKVGQIVTFQYKGTGYKFIVKETVHAKEDPKASILEGQEGADSRLGLWTNCTQVFLETSDRSGITITNEKDGGRTNVFKIKDFNFQTLGIGGLDNEFQSILRRAFASRRCRPELIAKLGMKHVKGMLLWGPPGTGKTLIARQIGNILDCQKPKIVNGPEVLSKYVGDTEKNVRKLFADPEKDKENPEDKSKLRLIIFDEIDAICKARGSTRDGTGINDSIVNQLLTMIDGVESLDNILVIGMTNRKDLLDEALLRPGRLEVQIEIGLPDEKGRAQILQIHSRKMKENSFLSDDVDFDSLARSAKNFSGAELEGLVRSATSFALSRQTDFEDLNKEVDENVKVSMLDFNTALREVIPALGAASATLERCWVYPMIDCGPRNTDIQDTAKVLVDQLNTSKHNPLQTCLLAGPSGSGKTALAAEIAKESEVPFIKIISAESMVGLAESTKCGMISKVFEDAYKSPVSIIIIDDIERILEYSNFGSRYSNLILQTLLVLIKRIPPKGRRLMIIGTTSMTKVLELMDVLSAFNVLIRVPMLNSADIKKVLEGLDDFAPNDVDKAVKVVGEMPIKKLLMLVHMSKKGGSGKGSSQKIDLKRFEKCYKDLAPSNNNNLARLNSM